MTIGVIIVTYNAADVIAACLETLLSNNQNMRVVVVDNASPDCTVDVIRQWQNKGIAALNPPFPRAEPTTAKRRASVELLRAETNSGFAAGVNLGLNRLMGDHALDRFWVLNPDTLVPPNTPQAIANAPIGFALMGNRLLYADTPHRIQIDAGNVNRWTGVTSNFNLGAAADAPTPCIEQADFISGASMVASRAFVEAAGAMPEDYFLYYEEVDWAQRRGTLPLTFCEDAPVYHLAGTAIGSPTLESEASPFSVYHKHRSRMVYLRRYHRTALPTGFLFGLAKAAQYGLRGRLPQASALLRALMGFPFSANIAA